MPARFSFIYLASSFRRALTLLCHASASLWSLPTLFFLVPVELAIIGAIAGRDIAIAKKIVLLMSAFSIFEVPSRARRREVPFQPPFSSWPSTKALRQSKHPQASNALVGVNGPSLARAPRPRGEARQNACLSPSPSTSAATGSAAYSCYMLYVQHRLYSTQK